MMLSFPHVSLCFDTKLRGSSWNRESWTKSGCRCSLCHCRSSTSGGSFIWCQKSTKGERAELERFMSTCGLNMIKLSKNRPKSPRWTIRFSYTCQNLVPKWHRLHPAAFGEHRKHLMLWEHLAMPWFGMSPSDVSPKVSQGLNREALPSQKVNVCKIMQIDPEMISILESQTVRRRRLPRRCQEVSPQRSRSGFKQTMEEAGQGAESTPINRYKQEASGGLLQRMSIHKRYDRSISIW